MRRSRTEKGEKPDEGRQTQSRARKSLGFPAGEEIADERWRPEARGAVQVDCRSAPGRDGGGEAGAKRERSVADR